MINLNKITLLVRGALGALPMIPMLANATVNIDDTNIGSYRTTGISTINTSDDILIDTTSSTGPHIDMSSGAGLIVQASKIITIGQPSSTEKFIIRSNAVGNQNAFYGANLRFSGKIVANSELEFNMVDGTGIYITSGSEGLFQKKVSIISTGTGRFYGIRGHNASLTAESKGEFNDKVYITSSGQYSSGIISVKSNNPNALASHLTFNDNVTIRMTGPNGIGVQTGVESGNVNPNVSSTINFNNGLDVITDQATTIYANQLNGKVNIRSGSNINNIISRANQQYNAIQADIGEINIDGKTNIEGDIYAIADSVGRGIINLNLTDGSTLLTAMENNVLTPASKGDINLSLLGNQSRWKMTNNSFLDSLTLGNDAKISFGYSYATPSSVDVLNSTNAMTLATNSLSGNGTFEMRTGIGQGIANDLLKVIGSGLATGNHNITLIDSKTGANSVTGNERITLVETEGGSAVFGLSSQSFDVGPYQFNTLTKVNGARGAGTEDWVLSGTPISQNGNNNNNNNNNNNVGGNGIGNGNTPNKPRTQKPLLTHTAQNAANILNSSYLMNYVETQTLLQRMGQLNRKDDDNGDAWGRIYTGKLSSFDDSRLSNFDMNYYGLQLGVDRKLDNDNYDIYYGIMGGFSRGNIDHNVGDGNTKSYSAALYSTLQTHDGLYLDSLVKYMRMANKFNSRTGGGYNVKGDGDTDGFSAGAEIGQRFYLSQWYIEPQAQLTYSHQNSATIKATNGLRTKLSSYNSLIGRTSVILGYEIQDDDNPTNIYFKTGYLKEFDGETAYTFNHIAKEKYDFGGNWWDNGIGINMQFNKNHQIYGDIVYSLGNKFDQKQANIGYRYSF
ncbi:MULTISPECIES: autotransporter outer membrane beta-barrel domain-containing protein [unclassified Gilliamella]|uniref:autotransporter outer membrane beta-barrel domain-containing protein n=1 Tax=unclassified Gilliamella TaxID=2685620 RepID=UPI001320A09A|nr:MULTISPECIES: autotransporter outer membrane beta-barrel domain-containing protein [unclassified Gilliamella]MWN31205.1 autotransporter outer membrane beta-barrel domain-containing protein [Gilliamella sp. Pra-s60]MWP29742.1 autotransporter outer membrane beta-barrel domain-containing protein [Gilliamella sp. Pra-s54]